MNDRNDKRMTMQLERAERPARTISANDRRSSLKCAKIFLDFQGLGHEHFIIQDMGLAPFNTAETKLKILACLGTIK